MRNCLQLNPPNDQCLIERHEKTYMNLTQELIYLSPKNIVGLVTKQSEKWEDNADLEHYKTVKQISLLDLKLMLKNCKSFGLPTNCIIGCKANQWK